MNQRVLGACTCNLGVCDANIILLVTSANTRATVYVMAREREKDCYN